MPTRFAAVVVDVGVMARACKQARRLKLTLGTGPERHRDFLTSVGIRSRFAGRSCCRRASDPRGLGRCDSHGLGREGDSATQLPE